MCPILCYFYNDSFAYVSYLIIPSTLWVGTLMISSLQIRRQWHREFVQLVLSHTAINSDVWEGPYVRILEETGVWRMTVGMQEMGRDLEAGGRFSEMVWNPRQILPEGKLRGYLWKRWHLVSLEMSEGLPWGWLSDMCRFTGKEWSCLLVMSAFSLHMREIIRLMCCWFVVFDLGPHMGKSFSRSFLSKNIKTPSQANWKIWTTP